LADDKPRILIANFEVAFFPPIIRSRDGPDPNFNGGNLGMGNSLLPGVAEGQDLRVLLLLGANFIARNSDHFPPPKPISKRFIQKNSVPAHKMF